MIDEPKFQEGHGSWNRSTPWVTEALNTRREKLFVAARAVHRAFIDVAASRVLSNLGALQAAGYYGAGVYREKASGARADRPELLRMIDDLQPGEVVVAERIDRISRLPLAEAERLVESIQAKGAKLAVPGLVDLSDFTAEADGVARSF